MQGISAGYKAHGAASIVDHRVGAMMAQFQNRSGCLDRHGDGQGFHHASHYIAHAEPHSAAGLVARLAEAGWVAKTPSAQDRRRQEMALTHKAAKRLARLTDAHLRGLANLQPVLMRALAVSADR